MAEQRPADLPADLEARLAAVEAASVAADFDRSSWFWMILLGAALPAVLILVGWCYGAGVG